jgi:hypothetical protein
MGMQRPVQEDAGMVAREWPAGAVGAVQAGCESNHQQAVPGTAERRDRAAVVFRMPRAHLVEEPGEPRTVPAGRIEWRCTLLRHGAFSAP